MFTKLKVIVFQIFLVLLIFIPFILTFAVSGSSEYNYVDNNISNVDSFPDLGNHSDFSAQQQGPDEAYDTLIESNVGSNGSMNLQIDSYNNLRNPTWTTIGISPYLNTQNYPMDYVRLNADLRRAIGDFSFQDSEKPSGEINWAHIKITLRVYAWKQQSIDILGVYLWDGISWGIPYIINSTSEEWSEFDVTTRLNTWEKIDDAMVYFAGDTTFSGDNPLFVDCALIRINYSMIEYRLDLEVQWTSVLYSLPYEELCINAGKMDSEGLNVDVWNGSLWFNIISGLSTGWNNISVSQYLVHTTFTIRFRASIETSDIHQSGWELDCTVLHIWGIDPFAEFFFAPTNPKTFEEVIFNASESYDLDGYIEEYFWDFGDGLNSTGETPIHIFSENGDYTITLTVTDNDGLVDSKSSNITVFNRLPIATFTQSKTNVYTFENTLFNASKSYDLDGIITSYYWDLGDGTNGTGNIIGHAYVNDGNYTVKLSVSDDDGGVSSSQLLKNVSNRPPISSFTETAETILLGETVTFNANTSYDLDGIITSYYWDLGDGKNSSNSVVEHTYTSNGTFIVKLTVTDDDGEYTISNSTKYVSSNRLPVALFTETVDIAYTNQSITFDASGSHDFDGYLVSYHWDFGDGNTKNGIIVEYTYIDDGEYTVTLTVTDNQGATDTQSSTKSILNRKPVAQFTKSSQSAILNETIMFDASGSYDPDGTIASFDWNFGDGTNGTGKIVTHKYSTIGEYNIILTIVDNDAAQVSKTEEIAVHIHDLAILNGNVHPTNVAAGDIVTITLTIANKGTTSENFDVTLYYNNILIDAKFVSDLGANSNRTIIFIWNTTGVAPDSYKLQAFVEELTGEVNDGDNAISFGNMEIQNSEFLIPDRLVLPLFLLLGILGLGLFLGFYWKKRKKVDVYDFTAFDEILGGGIPVGSSILISGKDRSSNSALCQQLAHKYLSEEKNCIYITCEAPEQLRNHMKSHGLDPTKYEQQGTFNLVECPISQGLNKQESDESYGLNELERKTSQIWREKHDQPKAVFLDSATPLYTKFLDSRTNEFLQKSFSKIKSQGGILIFTLNSEQTSGIIYEDLTQTVDGIIELEGPIKKTKTGKLRVKKLNNQKHFIDWVEFKIENQKGIVFIQPQRAK